MDYGKVAYIGGGNMARALAGGMLAAGYEAGHLWVAEPLPEQRAILADELPGAVVIDNNEDAARDAECIVLAVKPQILAEVCKPLAPIAQSSRPLIISIAAAGDRSPIVHVPLAEVFPRGWSGWRLTTPGRRRWSRVRRSRGRPWPHPARG